MIYKRIRASFADAKKDFYRNLYVRPDVTLEELGLILCSALSTEFAHTFFFTEKGNMIDGQTMKETLLSDMGRKFAFVYDPGEDWEFSITVSPSEYELDETAKALFIGGKGQGVWEDNKISLLKYLAGEINPDSKRSSEKKGYSLPWNFSYAPYGFFSCPLDKKAEKKALGDFVEKYLEPIKEKM